MDNQVELSAEELSNNAALEGIPKNFRQQADIEAFYRFVHENDLREEALAVFETVRESQAAAKAKKAKN